MNALHDQPARQRFAQELDRNFSVVASAGSGKTYAITERIVQLARTRDALEILPKLVVVTFTHRAADEMQQRTRQRILQEHRSPATQAAFNRAFFGTIHSFCMKVLTNYGHYLGLPAPVDLVAEDDEELWEAFVQQHNSIGRNLNPETRAELFRLASARQLMELGRTARTILPVAGDIGPCPAVDFAGVHSVATKSKASEQTIANSKAELADWEKRYRAGWEFVRWPVRSSNAQNFSLRWNEAFAPLRGWVAQAALCVAAEVQRDFRDFRIERGLITYPDQVALADELLQHPAAARRLREENFRVILDEAQDTDPAQFSVLTEITRPADATGRWLETKNDPPRPGHFCMVGDFQQSIYRDRADLNNYRAIHDALLQENAGAELTFSVTFRLDQKQLDFVNETFRKILNGDKGQVNFVELQPRPEILPGQVIQVPLRADLLPDGEKPKDYQKARIEAGALAAWIKKCGPEKLRADSWSDVAILCPRKLWLRTMATALRKLDLPVAIQSESDLKGDNPAYAWLTALCTIVVDPRNSYEIVGVLREVFGLSDHDLATFCEGDGNRFRVDARPGAGIVSTPLRLLAETRGQMEGLALFDAIKVLIEQTELQRKLASLPPEDFPDLESELDVLLTFAAEEESRGTTLAGFAEKLRADFLLQRDVRRSPNEGIQLITAQKAKGSEWQAVILPFLGRAVIPPSPRYPGIIKVPGTNDSIVALTKDDFPSEVREATKLAAQQEMARLLYVATTRARHTLVLALDEEIFARSNGELQGNSQLKSLLGEESAVPPHFDQLSREPTVCAKTIRAGETAAIGGETPASPFVPLTKSDIKSARERAAKFPHKFNPSGYDEEEIPASTNDADEIPGVLSARAHFTTDTPATRYGRWWHEFMQQISWPDQSSWDRTFADLHRTSPVPKRSATEWKLLRQICAKDGEFAAQLASAEGIATTEMPFLWRVDERTCLEGTIDFALINPAARRGLILDWKTNRVEAAELEKLQTRYRPQMAAYWKAVTAMTGLAVDAKIYSTATGQFVAYDESELSNEWERLRKLPARELTAAVTVE